MALAAHVGPTVQLDVEFKKPLHPGVPYAVRANIDSKVDRKVTASGSLEDVSGKDVFALCTGIFLRPKVIPTARPLLAKEEEGQAVMISLEALTRASTTLKLAVDTEWHMGIWPEHFVMGDRARERWDIQRLVTEDPDRTALLVKFGRNAERNFGVVHGGAISSIMDVVCVVCARGGPTASLHTSFRKPAIVGRLYVAQAQTTQVSGRKVFVKAVLSEVSSGEVIVESEALMIPTERLSRL